MELKEIKDFPGYFVSDEGDVYSQNPYNNPQKILKRLKLNVLSGYSYVCMCKNKKACLKRVHRLVAQAFIPNPENKCDVNHKNGIKTDNRVENLEWATKSENMKHAYRVLQNRPSWLNKKGKEFPGSKIILQIKDGKIIAEFYGSGEANRKTGIKQCSITLCCNNKRKSAGGYQWKYK